MAIYAVGDIQGCYDPLCRLLEQVQFDQSKDILWCVGDLVNRGPNSLEVLRLLKSLNNQCVTVLGNHDIHLLSMIYNIRDPRPNDTLDPILRAPDRYDLANWLRTKPLLHVDEQSKNLLCHAGIYPWWDKNEAVLYSQKVGSVLQNEKQCISLLKRIYSNSPKSWGDTVTGYSRLRFIINAFTRMRFVSPSGNLNFKESGYSGKSRKNRLPWFKVNNPGIDGYRVVFGHWSALGLLNSGSHLGLDTGCVWGRKMTIAKISKSSKHKKLKKQKLQTASL